MQMMQMMGDAFFFLLLLILCLEPIVAAQHVRGRRSSSASAPKNLRVISASSLASEPSSPASFLPEQIHLAFGPTADIMSVEYATKDVDARTEGWAFYGKDPEVMRAVKGTSTVFTDSGILRSKQTFHVVHMIGLEPSTRYFYRVGDPHFGLSQMYSFRTAPDASTIDQHLPLRFAVYGDMGVDLDGSTVLTQISKHLQSDPDHFDSIIHVGDMAYDMYERNGSQGDDFMNMIQPVAARLSYLVDMGNHEEAYRFSHYTSRFANMPISDPSPIWTYQGDSANNWWYSINIGPIHLVAISTEIYEYVPWLVKQQYEWLEQDLAQANQNRTQAPWIIVHGHKPIYCGSPASVLCDDWYIHQRKGFHGDYGLETLLYQYGVDLYLCGHQHNYERMYDVAPGGITTKSTVDPSATTYIVTGAGGNREDNTPFEGDMDERVAYRASEWGYSIMEVHNSTHLYWEQRACDNHQALGDDEDKLIDAFWLIQHQHGPFGEPQIMDR